MAKSTKRMLFTCISDYMCNPWGVINGDEIASVSNNLDCSRSTAGFFQGSLTYDIHSFSSPLSRILHITSDVEDTLSFQKLNNWISWFISSDTSLCVFNGRDQCLLLFLVGFAFLCFGLSSASLHHIGSSGIIGLGITRRRDCSRDWPNRHIWYVCSSIESQLFLHGRPTWVTGVRNFGYWGNDSVLLLHRKMLCHAFLYF